MRTNFNGLICFTNCFWSSCASAHAAVVVWCGVVQCTVSAYSYSSLLGFLSLLNAFLRTLLFLLPLIFSLGAITIRSYHDGRYDTLISKLIIILLLWRKNKKKQNGQQKGALGGRTIITNNKDVVLTNPPATIQSSRWRK